MNIHNVCTTVFQGTIALGTTYIPAMKVPSAAQGGCITVLGGGVSTQAAIAAGSGPLFELVSFGTNCAPNGTIGTLAPSTAWTAGTVREFSIAAASAVVQPTYWVGFKAMGTAVNAAVVQATGYITYIMGY
jgi:hypothetical protein